ncbi:hypothetical protein T05_7334 [Trichinella murrelli]|uniref:Uncharacterized protein n=1 Tax=Trichinella murrelli TaxID=144512 RepID=A0A0V0ST39_9BILA|nr:hypothetical protein T05_7334 [Trichinella murrelli]
MEQRKCENTDGTKQNKRRQEVNAISCGSVKLGMTSSLERLKIIN